MQLKTNRVNIIGKRHIDKYKALIERFPLRRIRSDSELDSAHVVAEELFLRLDYLDQDESDYLDVLSSLIKNYESKDHPLPGKPVSPCEMLKYLMEINGIKQVDLAKILGVSSGRASELVDGTRELSKAQISILSERFHVSANLFLAKVVA
jgi:HTH-type transcriptional regulator/antitoxin HigA